MKNTFGRTIVGMAVAASTLVGAFGLAGVPSASAQVGAQANVRVIHASPDAPAVDVYVNGTKAITNLAFKEVSSWAQLPAGSYDVKVTATGQTAGVIEANLTLEAGKNYSVVAVGKLAEIKPQVVVDDFSNLPANKARLRIVHASPDAPAVDVAVKDGAVLVPNLAFPNASGYLEVDPMTVDVDVRAAGTTTTALSVPGVSLEAGKIYTIYAVGLLNGTPALSVLPVVDNAVMAATTTTSMPRTGVAENSMLVMVALVVAAFAVTGGLALRTVRNR
ncbi:MAG: DUF4397 domain-containing protein [Chloroflexota bacterium]